MTGLWTNVQEGFMQWMTLEKEKSHRVQDEKRTFQKGQQRPKTRNHLVCSPKENNSSAWSRVYMTGEGPQWRGQGGGVGNRQRCEQAVRESPTCRPQDAMSSLLGEPRSRDVVSQKQSLFIKIIALTFLMLEKN